MFSIGLPLYIQEINAQIQTETIAISLVEIEMQPSAKVFSTKWLTELSILGTLVIRSKRRNEVSPMPAGPGNQNSLEAI
jgi:hypothetical protein